jgi:hypothetical protein
MKKTLERKIEELVLRLEVCVEGHRRDGQFACEGSDSEAVQTASVDDRECRVQYGVSACARKAMRHDRWPPMREARHGDERATSVASEDAEDPQRHPRASALRRSARGARRCASRQIPYGKESPYGLWRVR